MFVYPLHSGLVRGIDPQRKLFFITTPLSTEALSRVNCLLAGNTIPPHLLVPQEHISMRCPYLLPEFKHTNTGNIGYRWITSSYELCCELWNGVNQQWHHYHHSLWIKLLMLLTQTSLHVALSVHQCAHCNGEQLPIPCRRLCLLLSAIDYCYWRA